MIKLRDCGALSLNVTSINGIEMVVIINRKVNMDIGFYLLPINLFLRYLIPNLIYIKRLAYQSVQYTDTLYKLFYYGIRNSKRRQSNLDN